MPPETYILETSGLSAQVRRKPIRSLRMTLRPPDGSLHVSAPLRVSERVIREFIAARKGWIEAQRLRMARETPTPAPSYQDGDLLPILGRRVVLKVRVQGRTAQAFSEGPDSLVLRIPEGATLAQRESAVRRWYGRQLLAAAQALLPERQAAMGVLVGRLKVRSMRSRWGSCNSRTRTVTLAVELARRPSQGLEYVLVHELAHLLVRSHGTRFKSILDRHLPDWRSRRKALNRRTPEA
jgi:predicted metal-dependent hydrolase